VGDDAFAVRLGTFVPIRGPAHRAAAARGYSHDMPGERYLRVLVMMRMMWRARRRWKRFNRANEKRVHRAAEHGRKRTKASRKRVRRVAKSQRKKLRRIAAK
jgi:hypothetical protein